MPSKNPEFLWVTLHCNFGRSRARGRGSDGRRLAPRGLSPGTQCRLLSFNAMGICHNTRLGKELRVSWQGDSQSWLHSGISWDAFFISYKCLKCLFVLRERKRAGVGQRERERERERENENPKQAPHHQRRAQCGAQTEKLQGHDLSQNQELDT